MTRLAVEHDAVNLSQGFTDEPPVFDLVWAAVSAILRAMQEGHSERPLQEKGTSLSKPQSEPKPHSVTR